MSGAHQLPKELRDCYVTGQFNVDDPGAGGAFTLTVSAGAVGVPSGTRYLPVQDRGVSLMVFATGSVSLQTLEGVTVASLTAGQMAHCVSAGDGDWVATVLLTGSLDIEAQLDLVANGPLTEAALKAATATAAAWRSYTAVNGNVRLPPLTTLTSTWTLPYCVGGVIEGLGRSEPATPSDATAGPVSNVIWAGARTGTTAMLTMTGSQTVLKNCNLHGATKAQIAVVSVIKVPVILQIDRTAGSGVGTGDILIEGVCFSYGDIAINVGELVGDFNCDQITVSKCFFDRIDTAVMRINNQHGLDITFRECHFRSSPIIVDVKAGGHVHLIDCVIGNTPTTVFNFDPISHLGYGSNGASYTVDGLKVDSQAVDSVIVKMVEHNPYYADVYCERIHFPGDVVWTVPAFKPSGATAVHVEHCKNLQGGMFAFNNAASAQGLPYIHIDGSRVNDTTFLAAEFFTGAGLGRYKVTNCYDATNVAITDATSVNYP